jgi:hypothetical protein
MLTTAKLQKLTQSVKEYKKQFLDKPLGELDESGTRLLINHFLTEMLGYKTLEEVKTEYMIKGTYADYVIQLSGKRHFLVEVKALSLNLSDKHLRQSINYGANEGIDWVVLTNGKSFQLYRVIFEKPISNELIFSIDLSDSSKIKSNVENLQFLHKESVQKSGLEELWKRHSALSPKSLAKFIYSKEVIKFLQKELKKKYNAKFEEEHIENAVKRIASENIIIEDFKAIQKKESKKRESVNKANNSKENPSNMKPNENSEL